MALTVGNEWHYQFVRNTQHRGIRTHVTPTWEFLFRLTRGCWWMAEAVVGASWVLDVKRRWVRAMLDKDFVQTTKDPSRKKNMFEGTLTMLERERAMVNQDAIFRLRYVPMLSRVQAHTSYT